MSHTLWRNGARVAAMVIIVSATAGIALAWTGPLSSAPNCTSGNPGCDAPLNVSGTAQTKNGPLTVNGGSSVSLNANSSSNWGITGYGSSGIYGQGSSGIGVQAYSSGNNGLYVTTGNTNAWTAVLGNASTNYGAVGEGIIYGLEGYATGGGYGVYGYQGGNGYGGYFSATASGGVGVRGDGNAYGVYGYDTSSGYYGILGYGGYTIYGNGSGYFGGSLTASAYYYSSDARLKKDIEPLGDSLAKVLKLQPVTYEWKDATRGAGTQLGFIAQQVGQVVPELVHEDPSTSMLSVDYAKTTPLLVGAIQAQQQEIDTLKAQLASQGARLDALEAKLNAR